MQWDSLGFKENPFSRDPITQETLTLYTGQPAKIASCKNILREKKVLIVIEGARGVGTTSFANFLRFHEQQAKHYFTPRNEIRVEPNWSLETLLSVIIANIVREIDLFQPAKMAKDKRFLDAKALSLRISEAYRSFGVTAFGFGVDYGKSAGINSVPTIVPSSVLGHHLEDLSTLIQSNGYKHGVLLQLNNLDIGAIHSEDHLRYLFNVMRDYFQTAGFSWMLVGDVGLRQFIAQKVDRLDDIISFEVEISPLTQKEFMELIDKRIQFYRTNERVFLPIEKEVFIYLYDTTNGRLRYIFGLLNRLLNTLAVGSLTDRVTLDIAKPMIIQLARDRLTREKIAPVEEEVVRVLVKLGTAHVTQLAREANKSVNHVSNILSKLTTLKIVDSHKEGKNRVYRPVLDAKIAYSN